MRIEQLILENLIHDSQYASLIGVFLKTEYFRAHPEKSVPRKKTSIVIYSTATRNL